MRLGQRRMAAVVAVVVIFRRPSRLRPAASPLGGTAARSTPTLASPPTPSQPSRSSSGRAAYPGRPPMPRRVRYLTTIALAAERSA
jgi:hypothetical protein